jgi:hypothetical protein
MNILRFILAILTIVATGTSTFSAKDPDQKATPGPKGGRVLATEPLQAEFFVQPDKKVSITFYDEHEASRTQRTSREANCGSPVWQSHARFRENH